MPESLHPPGSDDTVTEALRREEIEQLNAHLQLLDPAQREMLVLRFAPQLSVAEIAKVIGKREGATRKQLGRTLRLIAAELQGEDQP